MEHNLTTEQLARVFGERIGQPIRVRNGINYIVATCIEDQVYISTKYAVPEEGHGTSGKDYFPSHECKLLLTPLEKISDEDVNALARLDGVCLGDDITVKFSTDNYYGFWILLNGKKRQYRMYNELFPLCYQFLIQQGYDIPMFFGIDHPDNGRTLIELGIAIDKTTI